VPATGSPATSYKQPTENQPGTDAIQPPTWTTLSIITTQIFNRGIELVVGALRSQGRHAIDHRAPLSFRVSLRNDWLQGMTTCTNLFHLLLALTVGQFWRAARSPGRAQNGS
jgi:hypothetical protein